MQLEQLREHAVWHTRLNTLFREALVWLHLLCAAVCECVPSLPCILWLALSAGF